MAEEKPRRSVRQIITSVALSAPSRAVTALSAAIFMVPPEAQAGPYLLGSMSGLAGYAWGTPARPGEVGKWVERLGPPAAGVAVAITQWGDPVKAALPAITAWGLSEAYVTGRQIKRGMTSGPGQGGG